MRNIRQLLVAFLMSAVVACGGGGTIGEEGTSVVPAYSMTVTLSGAEVAKGTDLVVTAELKSSNNSTVSGKLVKFSLDDSALASFDNGAATAVTDANGKATIGLKVGTKSGAGTVTATFDSASGSTSTPATVGTISFKSKGDGGVVDTAPVRSVLLSADKLELGTGGTDRIELFALVKDDNNILMKGVQVTFSADANSELEVTSNITGNDGIARAYLSSKTDYTLRQINVTATAGANRIPSNIKINVVGTSIDVLAPAAVVLGGKAKLTIALLDATGKGIKNTPLEIRSSLSNTFNTTNPMTDVSTGRAVVEYSASKPGSDVITISALGVQQTITIVVDPDSFAFEPEMTVVDEIELDTVKTVGVKWTSQNIPVVNSDVAFTTTRGAIAKKGEALGNKVVANQVTDTRGIAEVDIGSSFAGFTNIAASANSNGSKISTSKLVEFISTSPAKIEVQAFPAQIGPGEKATIQAVVRDARNNPVKNQTVAFSLADSFGGQISPATSKTNSQGLATTEFTADVTTPGSGTPQQPTGLRIKGTVVSNKPGVNVSGDTGIAVGRRTLFFRFGTGGEAQVISPNLMSVPYAIVVTDASGNPVPGQELNVAVTSAGYSKGAAIRFPLVGAFIRWVPEFTVSCLSEDVNRDGILEPAEDFNRDGVITPGNVATIARTVVADVNGIAQVNLIYPREYGAYLKVFMQVTSTAQGTENVTSRPISAPYLSSDYSNEARVPAPSPFGTGRPVTPGNIGFEGAPEDAVCYDLN
jgi:hypothetical protein